ncbi:MAG: HAMP domain-containing histidine kinase [Methylococcaceae bacterium]|nr:MAG: HAMP domain-containing histidine kinase [Methylococcaceae bacterium]
MMRFINNPLHRIKVFIEGNTPYIEARFLLLCAFAVVAFPLYYLIYHTLFPQPYENLALRLLGSALCLPLVFIRYWPKSLLRYRDAYWYLVALYILPFFFIFMLLMNQMATVWWLATLAAVFLMVLIHSWYQFLSQLVLGAGLAGLAFYWNTGQTALVITDWSYLPVFFFVIAIGALLNFSSELLKQERLQAMLAAANNIAHELRTPLLGIKSGAMGLQQYLPKLLEAYELAKQNQLPVATIRLAHLQAMYGVLERINSEADNSNTIIDMLLMNTRTNGLKAEHISGCSMQKCVETALKRYPFSSEHEKQLIVWNEGGDFSFRGVEILMVHVLFNLLKNALYYIAKAGKGKVYIYTECSPQNNTLVFRDTGCGIPADVLPLIFTRFFSWPLANSCSHGAGIGLAFCQDIVEAFGGSISCESGLGEYTEFRLLFPSAAMPTSAGPARAAEVAQGSMG